MEKKNYKVMCTLAEIREMKKASDYYKGITQTIENPMTSIVNTFETLTDALKALEMFETNFARVKSTTYSCYEVQEYYVQEFVELEDGEEQSGDIWEFAKLNKYDLAATKPEYEYYMKDRNYYVVGTNLVYYTLSDMEEEFGSNGIEVLEPEEWED